MTNSSRSLRHAVRFTLAASAIAAGSPLALAQQAPPTTATAPVEEVVVTGSRIQQAPNEISISPVTSVTAIDVQQTGLVRTEDLLNNLPQVVAEQSSGQSISSNGLATVSLRGLGSNRTLVLVNGKRLNPGGGIGVGFSNVADINQIPADLIERADVLTGGASAVYGADAVAGVVNFVLNTHYEGVQLNANYGFGQHKNDNQNELNALAAFGAPKPDGTVDAGFNKDVSFVAGSNFADGKGNVTVYATYLNSAPAVGNQYDYAGCTLNTPGVLPAPGKKYACGGSSSSATGRYMTIGYTPTPGGGRTSTLLSKNTV
jgi:iron complex outermembrane receptor protein